MTIFSIGNEITKQVGHSPVPLSSGDSSIINPHYEKNMKCSGTRRYCSEKTIKFGNRFGNKFGNSSKKFGNWFGNNYKKFGNKFGNISKKFGNKFGENKESSGTSILSSKKS